jgi:ankyrin repeat protein
LDFNGWTALHWAAHTQNPKIVEILLEFGANPNMQDFEGATPSPEIVAMLVQKGANPAIRSSA